LHLGGERFPFTGIRVSETSNTNAIEPPSFSVCRLS
jgi:hypothetical protein